MMRFIKKIKSLFFSGDDNRSLWLGVRCNKCGEVIKVRLDLYNQLSATYDDNGNLSGYFCRKVVIGNSGCYQRIEVLLTFDQNRRIVKKEISGGQFVSQNVIAK